MGYSVETKGYRLLINRDVVFDEKSTWDLNKGQLSPSSLHRVDNLID